MITAPLILQGNHITKGKTRIVADKILAMVMRGDVALVCVCLLASVQAKPQPTAKPAGGARSAQMQVASDLKQRLANFRQVEMPFYANGLSARDNEMVRKLVEACRYLDDIY